MDLFDILNPQIFKPLTGKYQKIFAELLMLIWIHCHTSTDYSMGKNEILRLSEDFLEGAGFELVELDYGEELEENEQLSGRDLHSKAVWCVARLRNCGWLEDLEGGYEEDTRTAICPQVVPILQVFYSIMYPQTVTYSGKLNKAYKLLIGISTESAPYENILKEVVSAISSIIDRIRDDLTLMGELIEEIDKNHITYRQRAVQRAQFMLLTDGTTQGRINSLLRYYAQTIETPASLFDVDNSPLSKLWRIYPTEILGRSYLKPPIISRKPTPIEPLKQSDALDEQEIRNAQQALLSYARSAVTMENVNTYAQLVLKKQTAVRASNLVKAAGDDFVKIIALHTYSRSESRCYEIELQDNWISMYGLRFQEFVIKRKV